MTELNGILRVAVGQWSPVLGCIEPNLDKLAVSVNDAADAGAQLLVTPELGLTGYLLKDLTCHVAVRRDDTKLSGVADLSRRVPLVAGFVELGRDGQCYNSCGYWHDGELIHVHRKIYLPTYGLFDEDRFFARGDRVESFSTPLGKLAMLICEDIWHPTTTLLAALQGAVGLLVISASPGRGISHGTETLSSRGPWHDLLITFSRLFGCWVAYSNRTGFEDGLYFPGGSIVLAPGRDTPLVESDAFSSGVWTAEINLADLSRERALSGVLREEDLELTNRQLGELLERKLPRGEWTP